MRVWACPLHLRAVRKIGSGFFFFKCPSRFYRMVGGGGQRSPVFKFHLLRADTRLWHEPGPIKRGSVLPQIASFPSLLRGGEGGGFKAACPPPSCDVFWNPSLLKPRQPTLSAARPPNNTPSSSPRFSATSAIGVKQNNKKQRLSKSLPSLRPPPHPSRLLALFLRQCLFSSSTTKWPFKAGPGPL